jgi:hypothetical protein
LEPFEAAQPVQYVVFVPHVTEYPDAPAMARQARNDLAGDPVVHLVAVGLGKGVFEGTEVVDDDEV